MFKNDRYFSKQEFIHVSLVLLLFLNNALVHAQVQFPNGKYQKYIITNQKSFHEKRQQEHTTFNIPPPLFHLGGSNNINDATKPYQFAKSIPVSIRLFHNASSSISSSSSSNSDYRNWKIEIKSVGAHSLSLMFDQWWIPQHAEVYVYNRETVLGAYTAYPSNKKTNQFATTPIKGDSIFLEYFQPTHLGQLPKIHVSRLVYGYKPLPFLLPDDDDVVEEEKEFLQLQRQMRQYVLQQQRAAYGINTRRRRRPQAGKCNIDLFCDSAGEDWTDQGRAVAVLLTNENQVYCTAVMLNNAKRDGRQLLLTAYHCAEEGSSANSIIMFNHQKRSCSNSNMSSSNSLDTLHGLTYVTGSSISDYALYEIQEPIPKSYNIYLAGWSTIQEPIPPLVGIHHPSGDVKKLSIYNGHLLPTCWSECPHTHHLKVQHWTRGTTEPGSSGSPLFDASHKVVGQLHGGSASCWNKNGYDVYGSFRYSWSKGLSAYLDPNRQLNSTKGEISLDGTNMAEIL